MFLFLDVFPMAKQSARFYSVGSFVKSYQSKKVVSYKKTIQFLIKSQIPNTYEVKKGQIRINKLVFWFAVLKSHSKKKKLEIADNSFISYKETKPDLDNLQKALYDACNGLIWWDDANIVEICHISKRYGSRQGIELDFEYI